MSVLSSYLNHPLLSALLQFGRDAAAALPMIVMLSLISGRRGHGAFCLAGGRSLTILDIILSVFGLAALCCQLLYVILLLDNAGYTSSDYPLWSPLLLPYSLASLLWLLGMSLLWLLLRLFSSTSLPARPTEDRYPLAQIKKQIWICCLTSLCFFATYVSQVWPFSSLPEGMTLGQAASAILRDRAHYFFSTLAPAGAFALLSLPLARQHMSCFTDQRLWTYAVRWCALWAVAGYIPFWLNTGATCLGYALRGSADLTESLLLLLLPLTGAILCWSLLLAMRDPLRRFWLAYAGSSFLLLFFLLRGFFTR